MPITFSFKRSKHKEELANENDDCNVFIDMNNNQHKELWSEDEKEEDKEHHTMAHEDASSVVTSNDEKCERVVMKSDVDESEHEELKKGSKAVENDKVLKQDVEKGCVKCKMNQESSSFTQVMCETLVSELKEEMGKAMLKIQEEVECGSYEEAHVGIDNTQRITEKDLPLKP